MKYDINSPMCLVFSYCWKIIIFCLLPPSMESRDRKRNNQKTNGRIDRLTDTVKHFLSTMYNGRIIYKFSISFIYSISNDFHSQYKILEICKYSKYHISVLLKSRYKGIYLIHLFQLKELQRI